MIKENVEQLSNVIPDVASRIHAAIRKKQYPFIISNPIIVNSHSQYLEDVIIDGILGGKQNGFYVDVGANHPDFLNNTKRFYDKGWKGINIEPNPLLHKLLSTNRTRDININMGVGDKQQELPFYNLSADTISTFNKSFAKSNARKYGCKITNIEKIKVVPLKDILSQYVIAEIDFMSIDVEGLEMSVLIGNDWNKYRPNVIIIETSPPKKEIFTFLELQNYCLVYYNGCNSIFVSKKDF